MGVFYRNGKSLFFNIYTTVARKRAKARKISSLSVNSLRLYFVMSFRPNCIVPVIALNSSFVSSTVLDEVAMKTNNKINKEASVDGQIDRQLFLMS